MKNSELIKQLQKYDGELEVTTTDRNSTFSGVKSIEVQEWNSEDGEHKSLTLVLGKYDKSLTKTIADKENNGDRNIKNKDEDEKFIDNINKELNEEDKLDKEEALKAKKVFDEDKLGIKDMQKKYKEWFDKRYDKIAHDAMVELFGEDNPLTEKTLSELKLHMYENGWQDELDKDSMNNRIELIHILYNKLDEKVKENLAKDSDSLWNDVMGCKCDKTECKCWLDVQKAFKGPFFDMIGLML